MIVINSKTFEELQNESLQELTSIGFSDSPGTIARLFLSVVNKNLASFYTALTTNHLRAFLSTSDGEALDAIGKLMNCYRASKEKDDDYRYRISQQCLVLATSNKTSVRLAALCTDGVSDAVIKPYAMGAGTFTVIVILQDDADKTTVMNAVNKAVEEACGYGIVFRIVTPTTTKIKLGIKLFLKDGVSDANAQTIRYNVQSAIADHIAALGVGEDIIVDKITQKVLNTSNDIISYQCLSFSINGTNALYVNQSCRWFERFVLSDEIDNIVIS